MPAVIKMTTAAKINSFFVLLVANSNSDAFTRTIKKTDRTHPLYRQTELDSDSGIGE